MKNKKILIWCDEEGDYLEINFEKCTDTYFNEIKKGCFRIISTKTEEIVGYAIFNLALIKERFVDKEVVISYNKEEDTLEINFNKMKNVSFRELDNKCFERIDKTTGKIVGYSISNLTKRKEKFIDLEIPRQEKVLA